MTKSAGRSTEPGRLESVLRADPQPSTAVSRETLLAGSSPEPAPVQLRTGLTGAGQGQCQGVDPRSPHSCEAEGAWLGERRDWTARNPVHAAAPSTPLTIRRGCRGTVRSSAARGGSRRRWLRGAQTSQKLSGSEPSPRIPSPYRSNRRSTRTVRITRPRRLAGCAPTPSQWLTAIRTAECAGNARSSSRRRGRGFRWAAESHALPGRRLVIAGTRPREPDGPPLFGALRVELSLGTRAGLRPRRHVYGVLGCPRASPVVCPHS